MVKFWNECLAGKRYYLEEGRKRTILRNLIRDRTATGEFLIYVYYNDFMNKKLIYFCVLQIPLKLNVVVNIIVSYKYYLDIWNIYNRVISVNNLEKELPCKHR